MPYYASKSGGRASDLRRSAAISAWVLAFATVVTADLVFRSWRWFDLPSIGQFLLQSLTPLGVCLALSTAAVLVSRRSPSFGQVIAYGLFFVISLTSILGVTKTLTGSHAGSGNSLLYGLSFYTASLAYFASRGRLTIPSALLASNPLLLLTGPIAIFVRDGRHRSVARRVKYYFPYLLLGMFMYQIVGKPLTDTFSLIAGTDAATSIIFAIIFEMFVYANFCGLSLIVYATMGIVGFRVPLNFRQPFSATNLVDFWRGWHVSLSTVLRTLFYLPLRGRVGKTVAIFAVFLSSAMWHGVSLNFVLWGVLHASLFLLTLVLLRRKVPYLPLVLMVVGLVIGRLVFADANFDRLVTKLSFKFTGFAVLDELKKLPDAAKLALALIIAMIGAEFTLQRTHWFRQRTYKFYRLPLTQLVLLLIMVLTIEKGAGIDFAVYGQR